MQNDFQLAEFAAELRNWFRRSAIEPSSLPFDELAVRLFALQFERNPEYRRVCEFRGVTPAGLRSWQDIPAIPTSTFKQLELTSLPTADRVVVFHSSGTTGRLPSRHFHSHESLALYDASVTTWFQPHVLPDWFERESFANLLALTPSPAQAPNSSLVHMFATVQREFGHGVGAFTGGRGPDGSWNLDVERTFGLLQGAETRGEPFIVLGTAFSLVRLTDELAARGVCFALPASSRVMETGGYKGRSRELPKADLHRAITHGLGVPASHIICEYGMSELSSQAYDSSVFRVPSSALRAFHFPPWCRACVISPETGREVKDGETGLLRVLDLANVWSVLAIQTEDLAVRRGDGFELLGRAPAAEARGCSLMATA